MNSKGTDAMMYIQKILWGAGGAMLGFSTTPAFGQATQASPENFELRALRYAAILLLALAAWFVRDGFNRIERRQNDHAKRLRFIEKAAATNGWELPDG